MRVDGNISDLFFNTEHHAAHDSDDGQFLDHDQLEQEATDFLAALERLGVVVPTVDELIEDFHNRL